MPSLCCNNRSNSSTNNNNNKYIVIVLKEFVETLDIDQNFTVSILK